MEFTDYIIKDYDGNIFISMNNTDENVLNDFPQLPTALQL